MTPIKPFTFQLTPERFHWSIVPTITFTCHAANKTILIKKILVVDYTPKYFTDFCLSVNIKQSMSKAGCPYDNVSMERYYNTLNNELTYNHYYHNDEELDKAINDFAYIWYNHLQPHTYNGGLTPFEARYKK